MILLSSFARLGHGGCPEPAGHTAMHRSSPALAFILATVRLSIPA